MHRRGPDASGSYCRQTANGRTALLLNTRLAIIDLDDRARQPYRYKDKVLTLHGEIYNYIELRDELAKAGLEFGTRSDTEVLIKLLHRDGWRGLDAAEGMWAFALFDETRELLLLSRDRFGEKPVYLLHDPDGGLYFGSEIKFISALAGRRLQVNVDHLSRYMVNGYKSLYKDPHGFFTDVTELRPGRPPSGIDIISRDIGGTSLRTGVESGEPPRLFGIEVLRHRSRSKHRSHPLSR
jgi:asparagine synthase (glutamine-hydrolysing)